MENTAKSNIIFQIEQRLTMIAGWLEINKSNLIADRMAITFHMKGSSIVPKIEIFPEPIKQE